MFQGFLAKSPTLQVTRQLVVVYNSHIIILL